MQAFVAWSGSALQFSLVCDSRNLLSLPTLPRNPDVDDFLVESVAMSGALLIGIDDVEPVVSCACHAGAVCRVREGVNRSRDEERQNGRGT